MSRFVPQSDLTTEEVVQTSFEALAIVGLCENAAWSIENGADAAITADHICTALGLARELMAIVHDAIETREGLKGGAR